MGVVGAIHLAGLRSHWKSGSWKGMALEAMKEAGPSSKEAFMDPETRGVKVVSNQKPHPTPYRVDGIGYASRVL